MRKITNDDFLNKLQVINPNIKPLEAYVSSKTPIQYKCLRCNNIHSARPSNLLSGFGCPYCGRKNTSDSQKLNSETAIKRILNKNSNLEILSCYKGQYEKIKCKCKICNNTFESRPKELWNRKDVCPFCSRSTIGPAPKYVNSIWADDEKRIFFEKYISEKDMKIHVYGSKKIVEATCPDCGRKSNIKIYDIYRYNGINCVCKGNISYPNRLMSSLLSILGIDYKAEYCPEWISPKRYDFYIPKINAIIEMHGLQHYKDVEKFNSKVKNQIKIDLYKKEKALDNGIKNYIEINCSRTDFLNIKEETCKSNLFELLSIDLKTINWDEVNLGTLTNYCKSICDDYNLGLTNKKIAIKYNINPSEVTRYLLKGKELNFITRDILDRKTKKNNHHILINNACKLYKIGYDISEISQQLSVSDTTIRVVLREGLKSKLIDKLELNGTKQEICNSRGEIYGSIKEANDKYGIDLWNAVNYHLFAENTFWCYKDENIRSKKHLDFLNKDRTKKILDLYSKGLKIIEISKQLKINRNDVRYHLNMLDYLGKCDYELPKIKKIFCIETGEIYENASIASKEKSQSSVSHILECCKGKRKTAGGFHWKYVDED